MAKIIDFPLPDDPKPFHPAQGVKKFLEQSGCNAVAWGRVPEDLKAYLRREAFASDRSLSAHVARILATWAASRSQCCQLCLVCKGRKAA